MRNRPHRQEVKIIAEYMTAKTIIPSYIPYPRFILKMDLSHTARLLYALLLDRSTLSQKNGWTDSEGRVYIVYPIAEIAEILDKGRTTVQDALNELANAGLMERKRTRFAAANHIYVKVPEVVQVSVPMTAGKPDTISPEKQTYDDRETGLIMSGKPAPNNYNINNLAESHQMRASGEQPAPFGRYKNLFLSESEYAELKGEYPDRLERFIEELSEFIAATGRTYANHAAAVRMWAGRDKKGTGKKGIPDYSCKEGESL
ncbi:TPA: replication initiator protein A [Clostridioides difficile]|uniref:replication initiator protein A n=2 Tax=Clostridia TaxID=186801 RepID=UPI00097FFF9D|nr:replication initiator protein A [Clostridium tertium]MDI9217919.1 replication initiator protein A [Clostridium tertium]SJS47950.1 Predicted transcriptional regulator [Clostridioides difficile]